MAESNTRFFRDQRYPDQLISLEQRRHCSWSLKDRRIMRWMKR